MAKSGSPTVMSRLLLFVVCLPAVLAALPSGWKACKRSANDFDRCLIKEVGKAIKSLLNGDKKMGVLPMDPLRIDSLHIPQGSGPVSIDFLLKNFDIYGIKDLKLTNVKNDWKNVEAVAFLPTLKVIGDYKVNGKVLVLPVTGEGKFNFTFLDVTLKINSQFKEIGKGSQKYYQMEKFLLDLQPKKLHVRLDNLFNGDKALGENMNTFINENWQDILNELRPGITNGLSQAFTGIANKVLAKIPVTDINIK